MPTIHIHSLKDVDKAANEFLHLCKNRKFFAFFGELGAGKTTFIKAVCKTLGSKDIITSPTFSLVHEYTTPDSVIYHMDFYRLKNKEEALDIGVTEYFRKENAYCFIEWPELIKYLLPEETVVVRIEKQKDYSRKVEIDLNE